MTPNDTLAILRTKERETGRLLENAFSSNRYGHNSNFEILRSADAYYLPAVNSKARIKWGTTFIQEIFRFFASADAITWQWPVVKGRNCYGELNMKPYANIELRMAGTIVAHNWFVEFTRFKK